MDGTIMETECLHVKATIDFIKLRTPNAVFDVDEIDKICVGATDSMALDRLHEIGLLPKTDLRAFIDYKTDHISQQLKTVTTEKLFFSQIEELMIELKNNGIKQAVVTSSEKDITYSLLKHFNVLQYFDFIQTRKDTAKNKPDPEPYLHAIDRFKANTEEILIFEDSITGMTAAKGSGAKYIHAAWY